MRGDVMFKQNYIDFMVDHDYSSEVMKASNEDELINLTQIEKSIMIHLYRVDKSTMGEIGKKFNLSKSATNFVVNKLVKQEIVEKKRSVDDNRVVHGMLTVDGRQKTLKMLETLSVRFTNSVSKYLTAVKKDVEISEQEAIDKVIEILNR